jgi:hypothetical protein
MGPSHGATFTFGDGRPRPCKIETGATGLEPATSGVTGRRSNQLNYAPRAQAL